MHRKANPASLVHRETLLKLADNVTDRIHARKPERDRIKEGLEKVVRTSVSHARETQAKVRRARVDHHGRVVHPRATPAQVKPGRATHGKDSLVGAALGEGDRLRRATTDTDQAASLTR